MKTITLSDISQEDFDAAAALVASGVKAYNRRLDTRGGTVLRDLLVNPSAAMEAVAAGQVAELRRSTSLKRLLEAQEAGEEVDQGDVDAILSNFNIAPRSGTYARGTVKVTVSDGSVGYAIAQGAEFATVDGLRFTADSQVVAALSTDNPGLSRTAELYRGAAGYFFLVPATASEAGSAYNIDQGTSLSPTSAIPSFVAAEAYGVFGGGSDTRPLSETIAGIPAALSIRGFVSGTAVEGMLRDRFDSGAHPIVAVSAVGYGNVAQRRDRHNAFGVSVGGRIDVYVRNFTDAYASTAMVTGERRGAEGGRYFLDIPPGTFPGACWIRSVSDPLAASASASAPGGEALGSLSFTAVRTADVSGTWHDFDAAAAGTEAFNTVWQGFSVVLDGVPADIPAGGSGTGAEAEAWSETREFKVTAYCLPQASDIQGFVDGDDVRSVSTDVVVRCPILCGVSVNAIVRYDPRRPLDAAAARSRIRSYINGLGFVGRLTRSEIVQILKNMGAVSVEMPRQDMLYAELHDAEGRPHSLSGDAIDISSIEDGPAMLTKDTVAFFADERSIQIKMEPGS